MNKGKQCKRSIVYCIFREKNSEYAHSLGPSFKLRVYNDVIWERVCFGGSNWRNMIFVSIDDVDYLESSFL